MLDKPDLDRIRSQFQVQDDQVDRVDHVMLSEQGKQANQAQHVFIVQGELSDPAHLRAQMPAAQAITTPVDTSFRELAHMEQRTLALQGQQTAAQQQDEQVKASQRV
ncbi:UNVERIFIED_CONTAM: hypothetical protein EX528_15620 [Xanthomonas axonopodis]